MVSATSEVPACDHLPVDQDDPEKRIADLERQLAEARGAAGDPGADQGAAAPPAWPAFPGQVSAAPQASFPPPQAGFAPPSSNWQNPAQPIPSAYWPTQPSAGYRSLRPVRLLLFAVIPLIIVIVVGFGAVRAFSHFGPTQMPFLGGTSSGSAGSKQLQTSDGLSGLLTEIRNKFGDTMGYSLAVYPDYAVIERVDPQQNHNERTYTYKGGGWIDADMSTPSSDLDSLVDLGKFDSAAVAAKLASAAKTLNVSNATSTYLVISGSGDTPGSADISIHVSGNGEGYMEINPDGGVKQLHPQS